MSRQLDTLARLGLCAAIVPIYEEQTKNIIPKINILLVQLELATEKAIQLYDRVTFRSLQRVERKIEEIRKNTVLGKARSILTFIELALAVIDEPARRSKYERKAAIQNIAEILLQLRKEIGGDREYVLSSTAAARAADIWDEVEI